eukprot:EG_transcript_45784
MPMDEEAPPIVLEEGSKADRIVSRTVKRKLVEMFPEYGIDEPDNVMREYIQVLLCNRKQRSQRAAASADAGVTRRGGRMPMDEEAPPIVLEEGSKADRIVSRTVKRKLVEMFPEYGIDEPDNV